MKKDIIYFTNGAAGNVGNVFIDLGSIPKSVKSEGLNVL
jgi:hypothetical protein